MAENSRPVAEPLQASAQAANMVRGAVKTGKAIAAAAKGAAAGGVWGAIGAFAWENRKFLTKVIIAATAVLMIPIIILCMLPSIIFGGFGSAYSSSDATQPILNNNAVIESNINTISTTVNTVMSEALTENLTAIDNDFASYSGYTKEVINPYADNSHINVSQFIGQYCAAKNADYTSASVSDMETMLRNGKAKLYTYTKKEEVRTVEHVTTSVTVDSETGQETTVETVTYTTENFVVYTVVYNGEAYFADEVFYLTEEQKALAKDYADNLNLFLDG